jgi:predicted  nucleic acid-binding Zn-ribbon protein
MPQQTEHPPERLRALLERAYDRIAVLEEALEQANARLKRGEEGWDDLKTRQALLEIDLQTAQSRGDRLAGIVRDVVNHPTSERADAQGKLLVALEIFDGRRP